MNSRLSLRTEGNGRGPHHPSKRGAHSKYGAGDSVSLSAMNERTKQKPLLMPPSHSPLPSIVAHEGDEELYANAFGPGHPQYLNELRRLKPDHTRMSSRLMQSKRVSSFTLDQNLQ